MLNPIEGEIFYIDKPLRWTSFDAVKRIRSVLARRSGKKRLKVGHAGTLDPLATGVLIVCTGRATKRIDELQAHEKEYVAEITLGATTPSFDLETEIDATYPHEHIDRALIDSVLPQFTGNIMQVPPAFSACKVDGRRAYKIARKGRQPDLKAKELVISESRCSIGPRRASPCVWCAAKAPTSGRLPATSAPPSVAVLTSPP